MARLALGVAGGVIGGAFGMPGLGFVVGSTLGGLIDPIKLPTQEGPRLQDLGVTSSAYGMPINVVYGSARINGSVIWAQPITEHRQETTQGGKGGPKQTQVSYSYSADFAVAFCKGSIAGFSKIWADGKLLWSSESGSVAALVASSAVGFEGATTSVASITGYLGSESQTADPLMESYEGAGNVPAYRGQAYIVFNDFSLEKFGNRIPNITVEVVTAGTATDIFETYGNITFPWAWRGYHAACEHNDGLVVMGGYTASDWTYYFDHIEKSDVWRTIDGENWVQMTESAEMRDTRRILFLLTSHNGNLYYCGGNNSITGANYSDVWESTDDGASWTQVCASFNGGEFNVKGDGVLVSFDGYLWVIGGLLTDASGYAHSRVYRSADNGRTFQRMADGPWAARTAFAACVHNGLLYISGGDDSDSGPHTVFADVWSFDGRTWTELTSDGGFGVGSPGRRFFHNMLSLKGAMFIIGGSPVTPGESINIEIFRSIDGITWTEWGADWGTGIDYTQYQSATCAWRDMAWLLSGEWLTGPPVGGATPDVGMYSAELFGGTTVTLASIITDICGDVSLEAGDIDVTDLTGINVTGYVRSRQMSARAAIQPLAAAYQFDVVESGNKIAFVLRGGASAKTITAADLAAHGDGDATPALITVKRQQELELPRKVNVLYMSQAADYQQGQQHASRLITASDMESTIEAPLVLTDDQAAQIADILLMDAWMGRLTYEFQLSQEYLDLEPTDVITVNDGSTAYLMRLDTVDLRDGLLSITAKAEDAAVYTSQAAGTGEGSGGTLVPVSPTIPRYLDIPILRDLDNDAGWYFAACGYDSGWPGCALYKSADEGETYASQTSVVEAATLGSATDVLGDASPAVWDNNNSVNVRMLNGTLASDSEANVLNGANAAMVGDELIQWVTATLESDGTYTLSQLIRGRRGTEWASDSHAVNDRFVLLSESSLIRRAPDSSELNLARKYKAATFGKHLSQTVASDFTNTGIGLKPYAPAHLEAVDLGTGNFSVVWVRRTRVGGEWIDWADAPLGEDSESYRVQVYDGESQLSTVDVGSESATVAAEPGNIIKVAQISAIVGAGYYAEVTAIKAPSFCIGFSSGFEV